MKTQTKRFDFAALGLGLFVFIYAFLIGISPLLFVDRLLETGSETTASQSISTIRTLQGQYALKHQGRFAPNFDELIKSVQLDDKFKSESPSIYGYVYTMQVKSSSGTQPAFYSINADPVNPPKFYPTDNRHLLFRFDASHHQNHGRRSAGECRRPATLIQNQPSKFLFDFAFML